LLKSFFSSVGGRKLGVFSPSNLFWDPFFGQEDQIAQINFADFVASGKDLETFPNLVEFSSRIHYTHSRNETVWRCFA
jgi:hypothetical protein